MGNRLARTRKHPNYGVTPAGARGLSHTVAREYEGEICSSVDIAMRCRSMISPCKLCGDKALKWAEVFDALDEEDQYAYLEELAPRMSKMHLQFLQGIIGFDDDDEEEEDFDEEEEDEDDEDDDEGGEEGGDDDDE